MSVDKKQVEKEMNDLLSDAANKFVNGICGIQNLLGIRIDDSESTIVRNGITYKIYFEQFKGVDKNEN